MVTVRKKTSVSNCVAMFIDMRGSSSISADRRNDSKTFAKQMSEFYKEVKKELVDCESNFKTPKPKLIKFLGDGVMLIWESQKKEAGRKAICHYALKVVKEIPKKLSNKVRVGIGLAYGDATKVTMDKGFKDYFGYIVNLASKLQAKAKPSGGIVIDKQFLDKDDLKDVEEIKECNLTISLLGTGPSECWATKEVREDLPWKCIAWPGYGPYGHDGGVHVLTHEGIQGFLGTIALWERGVDDDEERERYFDIVIDDLDTLVRWHKTKQIKLHECETRQDKEKLELLLEPISQGIRLYTLKQNFALVPIRCGVNAVAFNRKRYPRDSLMKDYPSYKALLK